MELEDFSYYLPGELIAQHPRAKRDQSRMLLLNRKKEKIEDLFFFHLPNLLRSGDVLVINDSRVIPAKLYGKKPSGSVLEILLLNRKEDKKTSQIWEVLLRPAKKMRENDIISLENKCEAKILARISDKKWLLEFFSQSDFEYYFNSHGHVPLPPYIKRKKNELNVIDKERYQTIYAKKPGSIAAPTAGLHFSTEIFQILQSKGIQIASITLHVGYGTFMPIEVNEVEKHFLEPEYYEISEDSSRIINDSQRIIAVGTTSTRTLESASDNNGHVAAKSGFTNLFIYPGYKFKRVNGLLTNFHLPKSSLFLLVCAFAGSELIKKAYSHAVENRYLFYSYGDCMLII